MISRKLHFGTCTESKRSATNRSLTKDLRLVDIPMTIKELANQLYLKFLESSPKNVFRQKTRDAIKFIFVFKSYCVMKIPVSPNEIIKRLGIIGSHDSIIKKGVNLVFDDKDGTEDDQYFTVDDMTPGMLRILELPGSWKKDIMTLYNLLEYYEPDIVEKYKPQSISVGIIAFYTNNIRHKDMDLQFICNTTYTSYILVRKISKILGKIVDDIDAG
jgi:hypothetical protein